jgi:hypothetical protein
MSAQRAGSRGGGLGAVRNTIRRELELALVEVKVKAEQVEHLIAERDALRTWATEACIALDAATLSPERSGSGDGPDHRDRLVREARELGIPVPGQP